MRELNVVVHRTPDQGHEHSGAERVGAQRAASRAALADCAARTGATVTEFRADEEGAPLPSEGWRWTVSHDAVLAAATLDRDPVGVDLARIALRRDERGAQGLDDSERSLLEPLAPDPALAFTRAWTAKEAVLKAEGSGLGKLSRCKLLAALDETSLWVRLEGRLVLVRQRRFEQHIIAVAAQGEQWRVCWSWPASDPMSAAGREGVA